MAVVTPMADEAESCAEFVAAVLSHSEGFAERRMIVVLDRATDTATRTALGELAAGQPALQLLEAADSRCAADAYLAGLRAALDAGFDWILEIDAGFSHDPAQIPRFFEAAGDGTDCVFGSRTLPGGITEGTPLLRRLVSRGGTRLANLLLGTRGTDMTSGFELFSREALRHALSRPLLSRGHFLQTELRARCSRLNWVEVPISYRAASARLRPGGVLHALWCLLRLFGRRLTGRLTG